VGNRIEQMAGTRRARHALLPTHEHNHHALVVNATEYELHHSQARIIGEVEVVDRQDHRLFLGNGSNELKGGLSESEPAALAMSLARWGKMWITLAHGRHDISQIRERLWLRACGSRPMNEFPK
jgi:hypothetical protein